MPLSVKDNRTTKNSPIGEPTWLFNRVTVLKPNALYCKLKSDRNVVIFVTLSFSLPFEIIVAFVYMEREQNL